MTMSEWICSNNLNLENNIYKKKPYKNKQEIL